MERWRDGRGGVRALCAVMVLAAWGLSAGARAQLASAESDGPPRVTMRQVLRRAQVDPPAVRQAHAAYLNAVAQRAAATGTWLPALTVQGNAGYSYVNQLVLPNAPRLDSLALDARASVGVEWSAVDLARGARISARDASEQAQRSLEHAAQRDALTLAAELYLRADAAAKLTQDAALSLTRRSEQQAAIVDLVRAGTHSRVDVERAKVETLTAKYVLAMRETDELAAYAALATAMGRPATQPVRPASGGATLVAQPLPASPDAAARTALEHRPELVAATQQLEASREDHSAAVMQRWPTLGLAANASFSHATIQSGAGINGNQYGGTVGLFLRFRGLDPVVFFQAGIAEAAVVQAGSARERWTQLVAAEAVDAFHAQRRARLELERSREVVRVAAVTRDAQHDRYRAGVGSLLELLDAEQLEQVARQRVIEAERDEAIARTRLLSSCGLFSPEGH